MFCQDRAAAFDCHNKTRSDTAFAHVHRQRIDRCLPLRRIHFLRHPFIGNDARVVLGQRHENQHAAAIARAANPAQDELLEGGAVGAGALHRTRHK